jgi:hypothetical protein
VDSKHYTVSEAGEKIGGSESDIYHYIETNQLKGSLLSPSRRYVLMYSEEEKGLVARGTALFRGLLSVHPSWIKSLIEQESITLTKWATPSLFTDLSQFSSENPYTHEYLPEPINSWLPTPLSKLKKEGLLLLPAPEQTASNSYLFTKALENLEMFKDLDPSLPINSDKMPQYVFKFNVNGAFKLTDLRISELEIDTLLQEKQPALEIIEHLPWCSSKAKPRRIDMVIERLYRMNPNLPSRKLWHLLEIDYTRDDPLYDIEQIIDGMDSNSLDWAKVDENTRPLTFKSFENRISDIRNF